MGVLSLLRELCPVEPQELGHRSVLLPGFVVFLLFFGSPTQSERFNGILKPREQ